MNGVDLGVGLDFADVDTLGGISLDITLGSVSLDVTLGSISSVVTTTLGKIIIVIFDFGDVVLNLNDEVFNLDNVGIKVKDKVICDDLFVII